MSHEVVKHEKNLAEFIKDGNINKSQLVLEGNIDLATF